MVKTSLPGKGWEPWQPQMVAQGLGHWLRPVAATELLIGGPSHSQKAPQFGHILSGYWTQVLAFPLSQHQKSVATGSIPGICKRDICPFIPVLVKKNPDQSSLADKEFILLTIPVIVHDCGEASAGTSKQGQLQGRQKAACPATSFSTQQSKTQDKGVVLPTVG